MGDRINFIFKQYESNPHADPRDPTQPTNPSDFIGVVLYSHWGGSDALPTLKAAIAHARPRWGDTSYCTRIMMHYLMHPDGGRETGFGIDAYNPKQGLIHGILKYREDYAPILIDLTASPPTVTTDPLTTSPLFPESKTWTFEEFLAADLSSL